MNSVSHVVETGMNCIGCPTCARHKEAGTAFIGVTPERYAKIAVYGPEVFHRVCHSNGHTMMIKLYYPDPESISMGASVVAQPRQGRAKRRRGQHASNNPNAGQWEKSRATAQ